MRLIINGRRYRLREEIAIRLQGIALILLGIACHKVQADGAAVFVLFYGVLFAIGKSKRKGIIYRIAKAYVNDKEGGVGYDKEGYRTDSADS